MDAKDIKVQVVKYHKELLEGVEGKIMLSMPSELEDTIFLTPEEARILSHRLAIEADKAIEYKYLKENK